MADLIQIRRDKASVWQSVNPTLALAEIGIVLDNNGAMTDPVQFKVGDGSTAWNNLPLQNGSAINKIKVNGVEISIDGSRAVDVVVKASGSLGANVGNNHIAFLDANGVLKDSNITVASTTGSSTSSLATQAIVSQSVADVDKSISLISSSIVGDLQDGNLIPAIAEDLNGNAGRVQDIWKPYIRTSAGNVDILSSEPVHLVSIKATTDLTCTPFSASAIRFNGFNALIPTQVINGTMATNTIVSSSNKIAYFRCVECAWGGYGGDLENNGYLFTDVSGSQVTPLRVRECTVEPTIGSTVIAVSAHTESVSGTNYVYYLPSASGNYLCVEFASTVNLADICAHLAWDNEMDDRFEVRSSSEISLANLMAASRLGAFGGMYGIEDGENSVYDEAVFDPTTASNSKWYRRCGRVKLADLTWSISTVETDDEGNVTTIFQATPDTAMAGSATFVCPVLGIYTDGSYIKYASTTISTVPDLITFLADNYFVYQLATVVSGSIGTTGAATVDDMGTEEVIDASGTNATITTAYIQGLRDYLVGLPSDLEITDKVVAQALATLKAELSNLRSVVKVLQAYIHNYMVDGALIFKEGNGAPTIIPDTIWQFYRDYTNNTVYISLGNTSASDWKMITNL